MSEPVSLKLKKLAILVNVLAELRAISEEDGDGKEIREIMIHSVEEEFREEARRVVRLLRDRNLKKLFVKMVFSEFLGRVRSYTSGISCANCEKVVDCRLKRMIEEDRFLPAWHEDLERDAILCKDYVPKEELISGREFRDRAKHVFEILGSLGLEPGDRIRKSVIEDVESSLLSFVKKLRDENKVTVN